MDIATPIINAISAALAALAALYPSIAAAFTGGQSVEEATKAAYDAAAKIPKRIEQAAKDLEERKRRGHPTLTDEE